MKSKKYGIHAKKSLAVIKKNQQKSKIFVITPENLEELLIANAI